MIIKELKKGAFFTKKPIEFPLDNQVFVKGDYIRGLGKYECYKYGDVNSFCYLKPDKEIYVDFIF